MPPVIFTLTMRNKRSIESRHNIDVLYEELKTVENPTKFLNQICQLKEHYTEVHQTNTRKSASNISSIPWLMTCPFNLVILRCLFFTHMGT